MTEGIWNEVKIIIKIFAQYLFSFSFPVICLAMPFIFGCVFINFWLCFLYLITIPALVTQRVMIEKYKKRGNNFADFWKLGIFNFTD